MSQQVDKFKGWVGLDENSIGNLVYQEFETKVWEETDVDIKITHCGMCGSDIHTLRSGWFPTTYPIVVGHEIVGTVTRIGSKVTNVKVGDRVGVGAQSGSCLDCHWCKVDREPYCDKGQIYTANGVHLNGSRSQGGYAEHTRVPSHFAIPIPEGLPSEFAAPMLCGGITVYSPLIDNGAGVTAKRVGIVGIGGLGQWGILFAKALGAEVTAISHSDKKREDSMKMGATHFINTAEEGWEVNNRRKLDLIICTSNDNKLPLDKYIQILVPMGKFILVGAAEGDLPPLPVFPLLVNGANIGGSAIGSPKRIKEMLQLALDHNIQPIIEVFDMKDVNQALIKFDQVGMRYRGVLVNK